MENEVVGGNISEVGAGAAGGLETLIYLVVAILMTVGMWKVYSKAGKPGWAAIIPIYNGWVFFEIAGKPGWWVFLSLIPIVGIVIAIIGVVGMAKNFGKGVGTILGLIFLPFIFYPILGFGSATYGASDPPADAPATA